MGTSIWFFFVAQNAPNSDWEKKVTEYFKEKLKENNATNWVRVFYSFRVTLFLSFVVYYTLLQWLAFDKSCFFTISMQLNFRPRLWDVEFAPRLL